MVIEASALARRRAVENNTQLDLLRVKYAMVVKVVFIIFYIGLFCIVVLDNLRHELAVLLVQLLVSLELSSKIA